ncbi:hypothetical protein [Pseudalkalibacillus hwajinpoensis]|uniref:hypothetical protein n=1 Tax=Guptibacillus hwajinpoensis TaxID=208199 RepID=UPI00384D6B53
MCTWIREEAFTKLVMFGRQESDSLALEEVIQQNHRPDNLNEKGLLFKTVGIAIFDLIVTKTLYEKMNAK